MVIFPNCKINLGLQILRKRTDGYHDLETLFYPIPLRDVIEVIRADKFSFTSTGIEVDGDSQSNLCVKAYRLLKDKYDLPPVHLHLHKVIPTGAGLGGGSSDAACTLMLLNQQFHLNITSSQLIDYALQLGSDCPFFIINKPTFANGRGENLQPASLDLSGYRIIVIHPGIHISTGWAFSQLQLKDDNRISIEKIVQQPITSWKAGLTNDFEAIVFDKHPEILGIKETLYQQGAQYASMSGSGSAVFGIFDKTSQPDLDSLAKYNLFDLKL